MESLGWITSCDQGGRCPQAWLEHSVAEIPVDVACPTCGRTVALVPTEDEFRARAAQQVSAWPVVPPIALGPAGVPPAATTGTGAAHMPGFGTDVPPGRDPVPDPSAERPTMDPLPAARTAAPKTWYVELESGERIVVDKPTMVIGRSRTCDVIIPSAKVSRQHATLSWMGNELIIEDLGSANGTWRDGHKLNRDPLRPGDQVRISDHTIRFLQE